MRGRRESDDEGHGYQSGSYGYDDENQLTSVATDTLYDGVLVIQERDSGGNWSRHVSYHADGNGNVTYLVDSSRLLAATYRYDPYSRTTSSSGTLASVNVYRFSSKAIQPDSGLYYYGYRFYEPNLQRWPNRDPLGEPGFELMQGVADSAEDDLFPDDGPNLYTYVRNDPADKFDPLGLAAGIPPAQGISIPPSVPNSEELKHAVKKYNDACKCGDAPSDLDCHTIRDAFYGNIAPTLVANCMLNCGDCELGKFMGKNPPGSKKKKKPQPKK